MNKQLFLSGRLNPLYVHTPDWVKYKICASVLSKIRTIHPKLTRKKIHRLMGLR